MKYLLAIELTEQIPVRVLSNQLDKNISKDKGDRSILINFPSDTFLTKSIIMVGSTLK